MKRIFVMDDNALKSSQIVRNLKEAGFTDIRIAVTGKEAFDQISKEQPDWLICDMQFPWEAGSGINDECGFKLLDTLAENGICIQTIIVSSAKVNADRYDNVISVIRYNGQDLSDKFGEIIR